MQDWVADILHSMTGNNSTKMGQIRWDKPNTNPHPNTKLITRQFTFHT